MSEKLSSIEMAAWIAGIRKTVDIMEKTIVLIKANAADYEERMWEIHREENREEETTPQAHQKEAGKAS